MIDRTNARTLNPERILETMAALHQRVTHRFPDSSLRNISGELVEVVRESVDTIRTIRQPYYWIRGLVVLLLVLLVVLISRATIGLVADPTARDTVQDRLSLANNFITSTVFMLGVVGFLVTLELRYKRQRALTALHELRAMAHIVDMHQLRKDPETFLLDGDASPKKMPAIEMARYLQYCTELLAILSKVAALYVEGIPDPQTLEAADRLEALTTGLSRKIWQKISLLDTLFQPHMANLRQKPTVPPTETPPATSGESLPRKDDT